MIGLGSDKKKWGMHLSYIIHIYIDISRRGIIKLFAFESFMGRGTVAGVALADGAQSSCEEGQPCQLLL